MFVLQKSQGEVLVTLNRDNSVIFEGIRLSGVAAFLHLGKAARILRGMLTTKPLMIGGFYFVFNLPRLKWICKTVFIQTSRFYLVSHVLRLHWVVTTVSLSTSRFRLVFDLLRLEYTVATIFLHRRCFFPINLNSFMSNS